MWTRRGHADHYITNSDFRSVDDRVFLNNAHAEACEIVVALVVHTWHLGRFAADERAAGESAAFDDAGDDALGNVDLQLAGGIVVEKEERFGALYGNIVDAHADEVDTNAVVMTGIDGKSQLGADPIGARDQHGTFPPIERQLNQGTESADAGKHFRAGCALDQRLDAID